MLDTNLLPEPTRKLSWRQKLKQRAVGFLGGKCCICHYSRCFGAMHFHHVDPTLKEFMISSKNWSWERLVEELKKCVLVCANCHVEIHAGLAQLPLTAILDTAYHEPGDEDFSLTDE